MVNFVGPQYINVAEFDGSPHFDELARPRNRSLQNIGVNTSLVQEVESKRVGLTGRLWRHIERRAKERRIGGGNRVQEKQPQKQTGAHHQPLI